MTHWRPIRRLPAGKYGICSSSRNVQSYSYRSGIKDVGRDGVLEVGLARGSANSTVTIYPHGGRSLPPEITIHKARPDYLTVPKSEAALQAVAQDPEDDALTYAWEVTQQPAGAKGVLDSPGDSNTKVSGLTAAGEYVFAVTVSDGANRATREVVLPVYAENQPPRIVDVHNRLPVLVVLPQTSCELRGGAMDIEGDKVALRRSLLRQPAGAAAKLEIPDRGNCKFTGLSVAGDYVVRLQADDGHHAVSQDLTVALHPAGRFRWPGTK